MKRRVALLALTLLLGGCIGQPREPASPTLADLPPAASATQRQPLQVDRAKAIAAYRAYLAEADAGDPQHARGLQRLADLLQADIDERDALATGDDRAAPPDNAERARVAELYRDLLQTHPGHADNAAAWYQLARSEESLGRLESALAALTTLAERYPDTPRLGEVHFRRGEYQFALREFEAAAAAYALAAAADGADEFREQALYKRGWSLFRLQDYQAAQDMFVAVLDGHDLHAGTDLQSLPGGSRQRVSDTLDVMALGFSYQRGVSSLSEYFAGIGGRPWEVLAYRRLGELYLRQQRYTDAAGAFAAFADHDPLHHDAPYLLLRAEQAQQQGGFARQRAELARALLLRYGLDQPYWRTQVRADEPQLVEAIRERLDEFARYHHARVQSQKDARRAQADVDAAIDWYRRRIDWFPGEVSTAQANFLLAELLYSQQRDRQAVDEYLRTAYEYPDHDKAAEAGYAALLAYGRAGEGMSETARPAWRAAGIAAAIRFAERFETDRRAPSVLLDAAQKVFADGKGDRARQLADRLLQRYPQLEPELRYGAQMVIAQEAMDRASHAVAETGFATALALLPAQDKRRPELLERLALSIYRQGETERDAGRLGPAAGHFLRVGQVAPASRIRANADFDAAAVLLRDHQWQAAADVLEDFRRRYPKHEFQPQVTRELAVAYLESSQWLKAAAEFRTMAASGKDPELRREAHWQSAELYAKAGDRARAMDAWAGYVRNYQRPVERAMEARLQLVGLFRAAGDDKSRRRWQNAIIAADARAGAERSDRTRYLAATAQLELAQEQVEAFRKVRLVEPIQRNIKRKRDLMQSGLDRLGKAAGYGVAEVSTAATYLTGEIYRDFGQSLMESARPRDLDEEALEEYELLLEEQAYPFEEKAIQAHAINAGRTADGIYDEWVRKSFEQLARLMPARYAKEERSAGVMAHLD